MDIDEAVRGARLLAADIDGSLGFSVAVSTEYTSDWRKFGELTERPEPGAWVSIAVTETGTTAALDPTEPGSTTAEEFASELPRILQDDIQIHLREPWPKGPTASGRALDPTEDGWQSRTDRDYLVRDGELDSPR